MAAGTTGSTSTYSGGKGLSFAKDIASRVVDAAVAAKEEKKHQQSIINDGGEVPEKDRKGLFVKALKQEFIGNPINDLKKRFNKKISGVSRVVGLFGGKGERAADKLTGMKFDIKAGFDRSGYKRKETDEPSGGDGSGGSGVLGSLGGIVLDIQQIAAAVTSMQGLIATQMNMSLRMSDSLEQIKSALIEQVSLQQDKLNNEEMAAREANLEASQQSSGTSKATSSFIEGDMLGGILGLFGDVQKLLNMLKSLPEMIGGFIKRMISKLPGGGKLLEKLGGAKRAVAGGMDAVQAGGKGLFKGVLKALRPGLKAIPFGIGGLLDFGLNMLMGDPPGKAAAKAIGSTIGSSLGALVAGALGLAGGPAAIATGAAGAVIGGLIGDTLGGAVYDLFAPKETKMASGGVMIGEAGPEMVTGLHSSTGKKMMGDKSGEGIEKVQDTYYSALAGSTLAITKDFVEGLGPVGSAITPVIQDDVSKLGRMFDLPATATKVNVGGMALREDPQAAKKGENYLKELVKGTLKKLSDKKDKDKKQDTKSYSSGSGGDTGSGAAAPAGAAPAGGPPAPAGGPPAPVTAASFGSSQLAATTTSQTTTGSGRNTQTVTNVNNKNLQKVTGSNPGKYYYDGLGNVYAIDKDEKRILKPDQLKNGVPGAAGNFNFFRNTNTGVVSLATHQDATSSGFYDYAANAVREPGFGPSGEQKNIWVPVGDAKQYKGQFTEATPYGKSKISAGSGISITSNSNRTNKPLLPGKTYGIDQLGAHHSTPGSDIVYKGMSTGEPKDYGMGVLPNYMPTGPNGKIPIPISGKVLTKEWDKATGYGRTVIADTSLGKMQFSHLSKFGSFQVGDQLSAGTVIGVQGGSGNSGEKDYAEHLHLNASKKGHEAFVNFITSGKPTTGAVGEDGKTDSPDSEDADNDVPTDPFEDIRTAISGMATGLALMRGSELGLIKNETDYKAKEAEFKQAFKVPEPATVAAGTPSSTVQPSGRTATATSQTASTTGAAVAGGGMGGVRGSGSSPGSIVIPSSNTQAESMSRTPTPAGRGRLYVPMGI